LQTGEIDVLVRNTTWSLARDTELGFNLHRPPSMMARASWSRSTAVSLRCKTWQVGRFVCKKDHHRAQPGRRDGYRRRCVYPYRV
jgi:hypothetical protein